ncbi:leucine-rich repeat and immunoglobulin-like domain-containing nogo receptor-interacting protein 1 [Ptychodera flava]|uniref:leucine-rich repeat and immunoglobulin-like domain-containing nogo receptor-interacting protein 1 n=1 Tax=Ptychodera flava TaxID=63121 RepID=UPI00396A1162
MKGLPGNGTETEIRKLNMTGNDVTLLGDQLQYYPFLGELDLMNNSISEIHPRKFYSLVNLYFLRLSFNKIFKLLNHTFYGMGNLETLDLADNMISLIMDGAFEGLDHLRFLYLTGNKFDVDSLQVFSPLSSLKEINNSYQEFGFLIAGNQIENIIMFYFIVDAVQRKKFRKNPCKSDALKGTEEADNIQTSVDDDDDDDDDELKIMILTMVLKMTLMKVIIMI